MNEKKFTPGPWATHFVGHGESSYADILQASDTNVVIATCGPVDEELANSNLIAAAPDLHDALEEAIQVIGAIGGPAYSEEQRATVCRQAVAALAKARGEM